MDINLGVVYFHSTASGMHFSETVQFLKLEPKPISLSGLPTKSTYPFSVIVLSIQFPNLFKLPLRNHNNLNSYMGPSVSVRIGNGISSVPHSLQ